MRTVSQEHESGADLRMLAVIGGPLRVTARLRDWRRTASIAVLGVSWLTGSIVGAPATDAAPAGAAAGAAGLPAIGGRQISPANTVWNTRIDTV
jgi:hypothetical protein